MVALAAVAVPTGAQQPAAPPPVPSTPEQRKAGVAQLAGAVAKVPLPMTTEPAVHFKA